MEKYRVSEGRLVSLKGGNATVVINRRYEQKEPNIFEFLLNKVDEFLSTIITPNTVDTILKERITIEEIRANPNVDVKPYTTAQYIFKRFVDYTISSILMAMALPVMVYSAYKIKQESPDGPIFFVQDRVGKDGEIFQVYKFRSMRTDVEYSNDYTQENDPRIFPWGEFMRKTRIDELPQLINVFKGEMHLVGPRAEWEKLVSQYENVFPYYHKRHTVAPGITGWAQVNYPYGQNIKDTYNKLIYDLYYIKNWSVLLELKTILKTVSVTLGMKGL